MIEVTHLSKAYGGRTALTDLSFTLEKGKVYGFLGLNGAGKSTTMNLLAGYLQPTGGTIAICGHDMQSQPLLAKRHIGYLPEKAPLYPDMTVAEYLDFVLSIRQVEKKKRRDALARILKLSGTGHVKDRLIRNLSKGYQQRTGIAGALCGFPEVLILDEPTSGLDPAQIREVREMIEALRKDHLIIFSTHILSEVSAVCDELLIIAHGRLVAKGTKEELLASYGGAKDLTVTVRGDGTKDMQERLEGVLREAGFDAADVRRGTRSLEEIFLALTADASASSGKEASS